MLLRCQPCRHEPPRRRAHISWAVHADTPWRQPGRRCRRCGADVCRRQMHRLRSLSGSSFSDCISKSRSLKLKLLQVALAKAKHQRQDESQIKSN